MADATESIINTLVTRMKAASTLNSVKLFLRGEQIVVPAQYYPLCEIVAQSGVRESTTTGSLHREITGLIRFSIIQQDPLSVTDREATATSYSTVYALAQNALRVFSSDEGRALWGVTFDNGGIVDMFIVDDSFVLGIGERNNNYENQCVLTWIARTREPVPA